MNIRVIYGKSAVTLGKDIQKQRIKEKKAEIKKVKAEILATK